MNEKHKELFQLIANSKHRKVMACKAELRAKREIELYCEKLRDTGFRDGNYIIDGEVHNIRIYSDGVKIEKIILVKLS